MYIEALDAQSKSPYGVKKKRNQPVQTAKNWEVNRKDLCHPDIDNYICHDMYVTF